MEDQDGDFRAGREPIENASDFKTPLNLVIGDATPERKFIRSLCERENSQALDAWLKNSPQDYGKFFMQLRSGDLDRFRSEMDIVLSPKSGL